MSDYYAEPFTLEEQAQLLRLLHKYAFLYGGNPETRVWDVVAPLLDRVPAEWVFEAKVGLEPVYAPD